MNVPAEHESDPQSGPEDPAPDATLLHPNDSQISGVAQILDWYLGEVQAGRQPDREQVLAEHPLLAEQLERCLAGIDFIQRVAVPPGESHSQLGDFRIVREVGRGGMGVVYEAEQVSLKRRVALKVLRLGAAADNEAMQRFQREAETVAGLHHTNIVPIFAIGCEQGVHYYAMQFIEGRSLATELETAGGSVSAIAGWGLQAAEALAHAHLRGVIHRDIKPSNLILDPDGRIWLTDFGLAKRADDVSLSLAGTILGTPRYMSPEQAAAAQNPVDHRTDIYSLGATLYELATGRPLFDAQTPHGVISQILHSEPSAPRLLRADLPRDFETIILKCLSKDAGRRYQTAQELVDDLRAFIEGRAIKARRATLWERSARWLKQQKRNLIIGATAVAATLVVVAGGISAWQIYGQSQQGFLTLNTPALGDSKAEVAQLLNARDEPVGAPFSLPTKEPLALPAGAYKVQLSAASHLRQTYLLDIAAGQQAKYDVGLSRDEIGGPVPLDLPTGFSVQTIQGEPRLIVGPQNPRQPVLRSYSARSQPATSPDGSHTPFPAPDWEANWAPDSPLLVDFIKTDEDRLVWQRFLRWFDVWWFRHGRGPRLLQPGRDIDGDGVEDLLWLPPHGDKPYQQMLSAPLDRPADLLAVSGRDGRPLWWHRPPLPQSAEVDFLADPLWVDDTLVLLWRANSEAWIEAVASTTGQSLWKRQVGGEGPAAMALAHLEQLPVIAASVGTQVSLVNLKTGQLVNDSERVTRSVPKNVITVRFLDVTGDDTPEVLATAGESGADLRVVVCSLTTGQKIWEVPVSLEVERLRALQQSQTWPAVVDLDQDGLPELVLPDEGRDETGYWTGCKVIQGATGKPQWYRRFPQSFQTIASGRRPLDRFEQAPDLDGDGRRELIRVSARNERRTTRASSLQPLSYETGFLYVDCFSGGDGTSLWWQRIEFEQAHFLNWTPTVEQFLWWSLDSSGIPGLALAITRQSNSGQSQPPVVALLSPRDGKVLNLGENLALPQLVDWNQDGLQDLSVFIPDDPLQFVQGEQYPDHPSGQWRVLRGTPPEVFRRFGPFHEASDFDGDGIPDLIEARHTTTGGEICVASGNNGQLMARYPVRWPETPWSYTIGEVRSCPAPVGDFDGDGLADFLVWREPSFYDLNEQKLHGGDLMPFLLQALSGKTGRRLWICDPVRIPVWVRPRSPSAVPPALADLDRFTPGFVMAVDLDQDQRPEIVCEYTWYGNRNPATGGNATTNTQQSFLAVFDGRSGTLRWNEPCTAEDGSGTAHWFPLGNKLRWSAEHDLNQDGVCDVVVISPQRDPAGGWTAELQARNGRDGQLLWPPQPLSGRWSAIEKMQQPLIGDLDGDGKPEIVQYETAPPTVRARRGSTGETLWTWPVPASPEQSRIPRLVLVAADSTGHTAQAQTAGRKRSVALDCVTAGAGLQMVLLDHTGKVVEQAPLQSNLHWSYDLDGDGGEDLLRLVDNKIHATSGGLRHTLWDWSPSNSDGRVAQFASGPDGRARVLALSDDSLFVLAGASGRPLERAWKCSNAILRANGELIDMTRIASSSPEHPARYVSRVGDEFPLVEHIVSRTVLPTDVYGRYRSANFRPGQNSGVPGNAPGDDPRLLRPLPWAPLSADWPSLRLFIVWRTLEEVAATLLFLLLPYWLITQGCRRRDWGRWRWGSLACGLAVLALWPLGSQVLPAVPLAQEKSLWTWFLFLLGGIPAIFWPATLTGFIVRGRWKGVAGLLALTLASAGIIGGLCLAFDMNRFQPGQHYVGFGWWLILPIGILPVGAAIGAWRLLSPVGSWVRRLLHS